MHDDDGAPSGLEVSGPPRASTGSIGTRTPGDPGAGRIEGECLSVPARAATAVPARRRIGPTPPRAPVRRAAAVMERRLCRSDHVAPEGQSIVPRSPEASEAPVENRDIGAPPESGPRGEARKAPLPPRPPLRSVTGFRRTGPCAPRPGHGDPARTTGGAMCLTGGPDGSARTPGVPVADSAAESVVRPHRRARRTATPPARERRDVGRAPGLTGGPGPGRPRRGREHAPSRRGAAPARPTRPVHRAGAAGFGRGGHRGPARRGRGPTRGRDGGAGRTGRARHKKDAPGPGARGRKDSMQQFATAETPSLARGG